MGSKSIVFDSIKMSTRKGFKNLLGRRFSRLFVLAFMGNKNKVSHWKCVCDCGEITRVRTKDLTSGHTRSCGCISRESIASRSTCHGESKRGQRTPEYNVWQDMAKRARAKAGRLFKYYGSRGIGVCDRWNSYANFLEDMGRRPTEKHTLDRIDNDLGYSPENCRWATRKEQTRNRRSTVFLECNGQRKSLAEWAEIYEINDSTIRSRIRNGWSPEDAVKTPSGKRSSEVSE